MIKGLIARNYWYPGLPQFKSMQKHVFKKAKWPGRDFFDPLDLSNTMTEGAFRNVCSEIRAKPGLPASARAVGFLAYNSARLGMHDSELWDEIEFQFIRNLHEMNPRLLFGAQYGFWMSNQGEHGTVESLLKEFHSTALEGLAPWDVWELIEAASYNTRTDYNIRTYLDEHLIGKLEVYWPRMGVRNTNPFLLKCINAFMRLDLQDKDTWEMILEPVLRKNIKYLPKWQPFYEIMFKLREWGLEDKTEIDLTTYIQHLEKSWHQDVDFQWRYNLEEKRQYTVHELIERADQGPKNLNWENSEHMIKHKMPSWTKEVGEEIDDDILQLQQEYYDAQYYNR